MSRLSSSAGVSAVVGVVTGGVAVWLHVEAGFTFPRPWPDESHFLQPALQLARHATLATPSLNAPDGIFWLPHGYYVLLAPLLVLPLDPLAAARALSLAGGVVFAGAVAVVVARRGAPPVLAAALAGAWLLLPRVVMAGDIARQEAPVLALTGVALVLAERRRWPSAAAVGVASALVHPIGAVVAVVTAVAAVAAGRSTWTFRRSDAVVVALVALAVAAQAAYFLAHWDLTVEHLGFQLGRKAGRPLSVDALRSVLFVLALAGVALRRLDRLGRVMCGLAAGLVVVAVVGREMWYEFLGTETVVLLLLAGLLPALPRRRVTLVGATSALLVAGVAAAMLTFGVPVFGMRADTASRAEWHAFVDTSLAQLQDYDASVDAPATVLVDPLSGFGQELAAARWRHLRFVQPTPVTPLASADLVLVTPGAPFAGLAYAGVAVTARSPNGVYELFLAAPGA